MIKWFQAWDSTAAVRGLTLFKVSAKYYQKKLKEVNIFLIKDNKRNIISLHMCESVFFSLSVHLGATTPKFLLYINEKKIESVAYVLTRSAYTQNLSNLYN